MGGLQLLFYVSILVFVIGTAYKAIQMSRMPLHLRWDLYPIPHEKGKGHYGGSYYEEVDWWTKPAEVSISGELSEMGKEIFFIQSMYHNNKPMWVFSFPFHFGLYLSIGFVVLAYTGAVLGLVDIPVTAESGNILAKAVYYLTPIFGVTGAAMGAFGALGLFFSRIFKYDLRATSVWSDYFNVLLIAAVFITTIWSWVSFDGSFDSARAFATSVLTFSGTEGMPTLGIVHYSLASVFMLWLPFTHMTHFVGKYFTYHKVKWEDHPNKSGSGMEQEVMKTLGNKITWSAPHIKSGGSWADAATASDDEEDNKK